MEANYSVGLCETEDFRGYGLDLTDSDLSLSGDNVFEDFRFAASADVPDTMQTVTITVEPLGEYPVYSTICRGRRYTEDGFDASAAGEYKKKIRREGMCDSVVVLTLEVIDPAESLTIDSTEYLDNILHDLQKYGTVEIDRDMAIVCIVGDFSANKEGLGALILEALAEVPIRMISYGGSEHNISLLVREADKKKAMTDLSRKLLDLQP